MYFGITTHLFSALYFSHWSLTWNYYISILYFSKWFLIFPLLNQEHRMRLGQKAIFHIEGIIDPVYIYFVDLINLLVKAMPLYNYKVNIDSGTS